MAHELTHVVQQERQSHLSMASLAIGAPKDAFEQEAETTAERVMSRPSASAALATTPRSESKSTQRRQSDECPSAPEVEPGHAGECPDIERESGELERFALSVETIVPFKCFLIRNLRSGSTDFGTPIELNQIADLLQFDPTTSLNIVGYSDCVESAQRNAELRQSRADEVKDYFVRVLEVDRVRIDAKGAPATEYVGTNNTAEGRAWNRSIAISISTTTLPRRDHDTVPNLHAKKKAILSSGGNVLDMAVAMLETGNMDATPSRSYPYGDGKTGDAANFGIFKQNWFMIRTSVSQYANPTASQYQAGAALNTNLSWDIQVLYASQQKYGMDLWFAGHRNGQPGLANPNTADINNYKRAVYWIKSQIDSDPKYLTDDTRFYVVVPAI